MAVPAINIFNIDKPDEKHCRIESFTDHQRALIIAVSNPLNGENIYLHFGRVAFYSGAMSWKGANFRLASDEERQRFTEETNETFAAVDKRILFVVEGEPHLQIRIFALFVTLEDEQGKHPSLTIESFSAST